MSEPRILLTGVVFGESARWHDDRFWFADWGAREVVAVDLEGRRAVVARMPTFPFSLDWLPAGGHCSSCRTTCSAWRPTVRS